MLRYDEIQEFAKLGRFNGVMQWSCLHLPEESTFALYCQNAF